jgi:alpha-1,2-mannosyltransferase
VIAARPSIQRIVLPAAAITVFAVSVGGVVWAAAAVGTLGFDFLAYHQAANRVLHGAPLYDGSFSQAGGFGLFYYPPPFLLAILPVAALAPDVAVWVWTVAIVAAFALGVRIMPVSASVRWAIVLLAGLSWPFVYAIKLGQVGPVLFLLFAAGWRWMDSPGVLGASAAAGALIKIQPALLLVWALLTRRWPAVIVATMIVTVAVVAATFVTGGIGVWGDYAALLRGVSDPIATPHNFTPGAVAYQLGLAAPAPALIQLTSSLLVLTAVLVSARRATAEASFLVAVIASQLLSPILWDHYAMLLLLPTAWLLDRGHAWAIVIPLATSTLLISIAPAAAYPFAFGVALAAVFGVGIVRARHPQPVLVAESA